MASHEGSRKRVKLSRTEAKPSSSSSAGAPAPAASASTAAKDMAAHRSPALRAPSHAELALTTLNTDIEAMRQLITCKICDRLLYEPYSLACGHTYCYSCLSQWLVANHKKTCPDCRATISQQPTPTYIIRELVLIFIGRNELLPNGETSDEHHALAKEEGKIVTDDRNNSDPVKGGLFKGCFKRRSLRLEPLRDAGDGVDRCPQCAWELEDGECIHCGYTIEDEFDWSDDSDHDVMDELSEAFGTDGHMDYFGHDDFDGDGDDEIDSDDEVGLAVREAVRHGPGGIYSDPHGRQDPHRRPRHLMPIELHSSDDESEDHDTEHGSLQEFVVNDDDTVDDEGEETDVPESVRSRRIGRRRPLVVISDDEENATAPSTAADHSSDDDSEDEGPVTHGNQRNKRGDFAVRARPTRTISSDEDDGDSDDADDHDLDFRGTGGFSPLDGSAGDAPSSRSDDASDHESSVYAYNPYLPEEEQEDNDVSDESEGDYGYGADDNGWGSLYPMYDVCRSMLTVSTDMRAETPPVERQPQHVSAHRLARLDRHSTRHVSPPAPRPDNFSRRRPFTASTHRPAHRPTHYNSLHEADPRPRARGMFESPHPFQLDNTLANVNYNQRNQHMRNYPSDRATSGASSQSSNGGVGIQSASSSGSSMTIRPQSDAASRRKRALSIDSDDEYENYLGIAY